MCVIQEDGYYATCVSCAEDSFENECKYWSEGIIIAAEDKCELSCASRCAQHTDAECGDGLVCVVQSDGNWDQCTNCTEASFEKECVYWSAEIKAAAEDKCGLECPSKFA